MRSEILAVAIAGLVVLAGCSGVPLNEPAGDDPAAATDSPGPTASGAGTSPEPAAATTQESTDGGPTTETEERERTGETTRGTAEHTTPMDSDGDGLTDDAERTEYGTDPTKADTDGDGLSDSQEVTEYGTEPTKLDTDGDGLTDGEEVESGTNPTVVDTDGDGLDDHAEVRELGTNATDADTDGDGLDDHEEVRVLGTNATNEDTDGDGLNDREEIRELGTNATDADTDGDGLEDHEEVRELGTNATKADTDGDGLGDSIETNETIRAEYLPGADPTHRNLYLNIAYADECPRIDESQFDAIESRFEHAPVANPDGETGIDLTITTDRTNATGFGYLEGQVVEVLPYKNEEFIGLWIPGSVFWVGCKAPDDVLSSVVMHELGHALGLNPFSSDTDGIDSRSVSFADYRSVMNYNSPPTYLGYSDGDWDTIAEYMSVYVSTQQFQ